jgi:hypothetical protein
MCIKDTDVCGKSGQCSDQSDLDDELCQEPPFSCYQGKSDAGGNPLAESCAIYINFPRLELKCHGFISEDGVASYGCGKCPSGKENSCKECIGHACKVTPSGSKPKMSKKNSSLFIATALLMSFLM